MIITYEISYREQNLWYVSHREEGVSLPQYLGKYKQGHLELGKLAHKWCELGKMGRAIN
jgi:hypothetical protein